MGKEVEKQRKRQDAEEGGARRPLCFLLLRLLGPVSFDGSHLRLLIDSKLKSAFLHVNKPLMWVSQVSISQCKCFLRRKWDFVCVRSWQDVKLRAGSLIWASSGGEAGSAFRSPGSPLCPFTLVGALYCLATGHVEFYSGLFPRPPTQILNLRRDLASHPKSCHLPTNTCLKYFLSIKNWQENVHQKNLC